MKSLFKIYFLFILFINANNAFAQRTLENYLVSRGVENLCQTAHPSNDFLSGTYDIFTGHIDVSIKSKDNVFGSTIYTDIQVVKGTGDLYFSDLIVQNDNDFYRPFEAFKIQASTIPIIIKAIDPETYNKIKAAIGRIFNTDIEKWTGKIWALVALNVDYYYYLIGN